MNINFPFPFGAALENISINLTQKANKHTQYVTVHVRCGKNDHNSL